MHRDGRGGAPASLRVATIPPYDMSVLDWAEAFASSCKLARADGCARGCMSYAFVMLADTSKIAPVTVTK